MANSDVASALTIEVDGLAVRGVVCAVPASEVGNDTFVAQFGEDGVRDVIKMIGVQARRVAPADQTAADLCQGSAERLLDDLGWERDSVDALIFVSQTPDYTLPASACALQGRMGLKRACAAFDVNLGCSGYVYGLWLASKLLDGRAVKRVLLLAGETPSKITSPHDRATAQGDCMKDYASARAEVQILLVNLDRKAFTCAIWARRWQTNRCRWCKHSMICKIPVRGNARTNSTSYCWLRSAPSSAGRRVGPRSSNGAR